MPIKVFKVYHCVEGRFVGDGPLTTPHAQRQGLVTGALIGMSPHPQADGPGWSIDFTFGSAKEGYQTIPMSLECFMSASEYKRSLEGPLWFEHLEMWPAPNEKDLPSRLPTCVWIYRDALYLTERPPRISELDEVVLRIKALHFQEGEVLKRLREQVANMEAISQFTAESPGRQPIPDDVKLLVWSRDGGRCVRCGSAAELHFDHIIPLSRGGGDHAENIQILCRTCNLAKGARLL